MIINGKVHLFFEQSGTFKNEFIKLGIPAEDYDIQDNFGETDHVTDLFAEIEKGYEGGGKFGRLDNGRRPDNGVLPVHLFLPGIPECLHVHLQQLCEDGHQAEDRGYTGAVKEQGIFLHVAYQAVRHRADEGAAYGG